MKKFLSFLLVFSLVFSNFGMISFAEEQIYETELEADGDVEEVTSLNTQSRYYNFNQNYTLTGNQAADVVTVAAAQIGKSQSSLGYTEAWCADFVCDVGRLAGVPSNVIPWEYSARGGVSYLYNYMLNYCGATKVSSRQAGDFVFYYCNSCGTFCHVGIVVDSSYQIEGNMWTNGYSQVYKYNTYYQDENGHSASSGTISRIYVRPNYGNSWYTSLSPVNLGSDFYATIINNQAGLFVGNVNGNVELTGTDGKNVQWHFVRQSDGSYIIYNNSDNKVIDVADAATASGTNVQVYTQWGDDNTAQKWFIYSAGGGQYILRSKSCDKVLDVSNGNTAVGTNIQIWEYNNTAAQKFYISEFDQVGTPTVSVNKGDATTPTKISWTAAENVRYYDLYIVQGSDDNIIVYKQITNMTDTSYSLTLPSGDYKVYVVARNSYTTQTSNTVEFTIKGDTTKPVIDEDSLSVIQLGNNHMKVRVKVTDNVGVEKVKMCLYKMEIGNEYCWLEREYWFQQTMTYNNGYYEAEYDGSLGKLGVECPVEVELYAYDAAGNQAVNYMNDYRADKTLVWTKGGAFFATEGQYNAVIDKGEIIKLNHETTGAVSDHIDFYTTNPEVVSVDEDGKVTAVKAGTAVVFVIRWQSNSAHWVEATYKITVTDSSNPFTDVNEDSYYYEPVLWAVKEGITQGTSATTFSPAATCTRGQVVTFLWRANGSPEPTSSVNPFADVKTSDYFYKAVLWAVEEGITQGTSATTFSPAATCTRGQVVTFLWRAENEPDPVSTENPFADITVKDYYYKAVLWAVENGITQGTGTATFGPKLDCSRGQVVTFLYRAQ